MGRAKATALHNGKAKMEEKLPRPKLKEVFFEYFHDMVSILLFFYVAHKVLMLLLSNTLDLDSEYFQNKWQNIIDEISDLRIIFIVAPLVVTLTFYWSWGFFFTFLDMTGWLSKYKVQPDTNQPPDTAKFIKAILVVLFNQIVLGIPILFGTYYLAKSSGTLMPIEQLRILPSFTSVLMELPFLIMAQEFAFYYSHRMLHYKWFYKYIHKKHHEWTSPIAIMTIYAHPIEHIFSNVTPVFLGPALMRSHPVTAWFWVAYVMSHSTNSHSGYHLPVIHSAEFHDYHHLKFNQNYGSIGLLDHIHGTDAQWRQTKSWQRHFYLYSLKPVRHFVPDAKED